MYSLLIWGGLFKFLAIYTSLLNNTDWYVYLLGVASYFLAVSIIFYIFGYTISRIFNLQQHYK